MHSKIEKSVDMHKKRNVTIVLSIIVAFVVGFILLDNTSKPTKNNDANKIISSRNAEDQENKISDSNTKKTKEPFLMTYDDLVKSGSVKSDDIKDISNEPYSYDAGNKDKSNDDSKNNAKVTQQKSSNNSNDNSSKRDSEIEKQGGKTKVVDESNKTMKDESVEYEYKGEVVTSKVFNFFDVKASGGKEVNGNSKASGKHVGIWN
ncbi:hypothetical protein [Anaeromicropila herbilytica]|uniref:Uncharacterized protein n=1 Tax=Anaeromicropila herbilytica TaxID=2785025 RepID=A0A7R7EJD9_9FIRM|nr:hypothetical protein [Anaeromicropila herbilytica]BCN29537.1 hypothetical protein bsdtb5_08320 [Anaeromicropila herbilytica]